eukprot:2714335-Alexandrium_andersonii.AAC.1
MALPIESSPSAAPRKLSSARPAQSADRPTRKGRNATRAGGCACPQMKTTNNMAKVRGRARSTKQ